MPPYTASKARHAVSCIPFPSDDDVLAAILIRMWELASGRTLRRDIRPEQLTEEELISFWADDLTPASGRHTATADRETPQAA
jgi:hypothetical protein